MIPTGFAVLTVLMILALPVAIYTLSDTDSSSRYQAVKHYIIGITVWLIYVMTLSKSGFLESMSLPPRMPLLIILLGLLLFASFTTKWMHKETLLRLPSHFPIYIQSFRIVVELLIYGAFVEGVLPERVTFEGLNYDILVGISALPMGFLVQTGKVGKKGILLWNIASAIVLTFTGYAFMSSFYVLELASPMQIHQFLTFPYILLPSVLLIFAFFYHILSIKQALQQ